MNEPDLDWLALQYVSDALSAEDQQQFEQRLQYSQAAREAVARAVELTLASEFACRERAMFADLVSPRPIQRRANPETHPGIGRRRLARNPRVRQSLWTLAALGMFAVGWYAAGLVRSGAPRSANDELASPSRRHSTVLDHDGGNLALMWHETRRLFAPSMEGGAQGSPGVDEPEVFVGFPTVGEELISPNWMLAAVAGMQEDDPAMRTPATEGNWPRIAPDALKTPDNQANEG